MADPTIVRNDHIPWLDTLRGIAILFVVLGHTIPVNRFYVYIYSFHMPLFFWISGYLFDASRYTELRSYAVRKARTLLIPYAVFYAVILAYYTVNPFSTIQIALFRPPFNGATFIFGELKTFLYASRDIHVLEQTGLLWFLPCLFVVEIMFYAIYKLVDGKINMLAGLSVLSLLLGYAKYTFFFETSFPWFADIALTAVFFYGCGFLMKSRSTIEWMSKRPFMLAVLLIAAYFCFEQRGPVAPDMRIGYYGNFWMYILAAISGTFFYALLSRKTGSIRLPAYLGKNTLIIFGLHGLIKETGIWALNAGVALFTARDILIDEVVYGFIIAAMIVAFFIPVIELMNYTLAEWRNRRAGSAA